MHITSIIHKKHYHINFIDERDYSPIVFERKEKLDKINISYQKVLLDIF